MNQVDNELEQEQVVTSVLDRILHAELKEKKFIKTKEILVYVHSLHRELMIGICREEHQDQSSLLTYVQRLKHLHHRLLR